MADTDFPLVAEAPFWRAATPDEFGRIVGHMPEPGDLDFPEGWQLAFFSISQADSPRTAAWGWVKGCFAVAVITCGEGTVGCLTHLPTGYRIAEFLTEEEAAFAADAILPLADWPTVTPASTRGIRLKRALTQAGFVEQWVWDGKVPVPVFCLETTGRAQ